MKEKQSMSRFTSTLGTAAEDSGYPTCRGNEPIDPVRLHEGESSSPCEPTTSNPRRAGR